MSSRLLPDARFARGKSGRLLRAALLGSRIIIGGVFVASSLPKLRYPYEFLSDVYAYALLDPNSGLLVAMVLPALELAIGLALLGGIFVSGAFLAASGLLLASSIAQVSAIHRDLAINCGCFGVGAGGHLVSYATFARTLTLLLVALTGFGLVIFALPSAERICDRAENETESPEKVLC